MNQTGIYRKLASKLGGYDIFISYRHLDAEAYAAELHGILEKKGMIVFRDESEQDNLGTSTSDFSRIVRSARCLVTIVTENVYESQSVYEELSSYLQHRIDKWYRRPFSRIISVNVGQSLSKATAKSSGWSRLSSFVYEPETQDAVDRGEPSADVITRLTDAGRFMNSWRRFLIIMLFAAFTAFALTAGAMIYLNGLKKNISSTRLQLSKIADSTSKLSTANRTLSKLNQHLQTSSDSLSARGKVLEHQSDSLGKQGKMLSIRNAATNQLAYDPLIAYRLAQQAYQISPDAENRKLILASLSKIDMYYKNVLEGYTIEDFKDPWVLVSKPVQASWEKAFAVLDTRTLQVRPIEEKADGGWLIPVKDSWRFLAETWQGQGLDAIDQYQLWDNTGKPLSERIKKGGVTRIQFLNKTKISIQLYRQPKKLVWNLVSGERKYIRNDTADRSDTYFYDIYGAFDTRKDGSSAAHFRNGLVLTDGNGNILQNTYTQVEFDPAFSRASWSEDGTSLALNFIGEGNENRLGLWNPVSGSFVWLDPHGWVVDSYAWSLGGHLVAYAGRTENDIDVSITLANASDPLQTRRVIYKGSAPVKNMVFLPHDKELAVCDGDGNINVIDIATGTIIRKGFQKGVKKLYSSKNIFLSAGASEVRVWGTEDIPARSWTFQSVKDRTYHADGAADPTFGWLAVPFSNELSKTSGVELRKIATGTKKELPAPHEPNAIEFSQDGRWLILETFDTVRIWNTGSWQYTDFPLVSADHQYYTLKLAGNSAIAHVLGKDVMENNGAEYDYVFDLDRDKPVMRSRVKVKKEIEGRYRLRGNDVKSQTDGWDSGNLYKYLSAGMTSAPNSGWAVFVKCRDQPLGASNCDVQFIPIDLQRLTALYDRYLWKPVPAQLLSESIAKTR